MKHREARMGSDRATRRGRSRWSWCVAAAQVGAMAVAPEAMPDFALA
jgi:hypothetical protein